LLYLYYKVILFVINVILNSQTVLKIFLQTPLFCLTPEHKLLLDFIDFYFLT